jgi:hypothetical protein
MRDGAVYANVGPAAARDNCITRSMFGLSVVVLIVALVLVALIALVQLATARFHARVAAEVRGMFAERRAPRTGPDVVRPDELAGLPVPVRRWLEGAGVVGRERAQTVRLRQRGELHTANDAPWMPVEAEQYVTVEDPGFVWWMDSRMMKVVPLCGRDRYVHGEGEMLVRVAGLVNVANERGPKIDQGAMLRYLGEIIWFPSAALRPYIAWEPIDDTHAKATMTNHGVTASAVYTFDERGRAASMSAERYYGASGGLERWGGESTEWRVIGGVEIPVRGQVVWHLKEGDFTFFRWEIVDVETNRPALYDDDPETGRSRDAGFVLASTRGESSRVMR